MSSLTLFRQLIRYATTGWRRKALTGGFVLLTLAVIGQILFVNRESLRDYLGEIRPIFLPLIALLFTVDLLISLAGWHTLVKKLTTLDSFRINTKINLYSNLARRIPGGIWYVASRAALYEQNGVSKRKTALLSALEITFFISSGVVVSLFSLALWELPLSFVEQIPSVGFLVIAFLAAFALMHPHVVSRVWKFIAKEAVPQQLAWRDTLGLLAIYVGTWLVGGLVLHAVINLFYPLPLTQIPMSIGVWTLSGTISLVGFISFSFFGLREVSLVLLLTPILPLPLTILIGIVIRLVWLSGELISALYSFRL